MAETAAKVDEASVVEPEKPNPASGKENPAGEPAKTASNGTSEVDPKSRTILSQQRADENSKKIAAQIEFYLGDFNLGSDKFFRDFVQKDEGWVPVDAIMKCNRVKKYTSNPVDIIPSLQKFSKMFEVDEAGQKIRRTEAFVATDDTDAARSDRDGRTVHVKRFMRNHTIDAMQDYFRKFGPVDGIVMNKFQEGDPKLRNKFKGSVSVIFKNKADAEKYIKGSEEETKFDGKEMVREWSADHAEHQKKFLVEKKDHIEKSKIPSSVLHLSTQRAIDYMKVREFFSQRQPVEYVDHQRGQREARVRFKEGVAKEVLENLLAHNNNKIVIDGTQYKGRVLEGKEEQTYFDTYWDTFLEAKNNRILRNMRNDPKGQFKYQPAAKGQDKNKGDVAKEDNGKVDNSAKEKISEKSPEKSAVSEPDSIDSPTKKRSAADEGSPDSKKIKSADSTTPEAQAS